MYISINHYLTSSKASIWRYCFIFGAISTFHFFLAGRFYRVILNFKPLGFGYFTFFQQFYWHFAWLWSVSHDINYILRFTAWIIPLWMCAIFSAVSVEDLGSADVIFYIHLSSFLSPISSGAQWHIVGSPLLLFHLISTARCIFHRCNQERFLVAA